MLGYFQVWPQLCREIKRFERPSSVDLHKLVGSANLLTLFDSGRYCTGFEPGAIAPGRSMRALESSTTSYLSRTAKGLYWRNPAKGLQS
jgi:hypothetical protein